MLSQRARYALRAMSYLASRKTPGPTRIAEIAEQAAAPHKFLEVILQELKRHRLVISTRGRSGGYYLARHPAEISFADVIRAVDGPLALAPCAMRSRRTCETCPDLRSCPVQPALAAARDAVAAVLEGWTLDQADHNHVNPD